VTCRCDLLSLRASWGIVFLVFLAATLVLWPPNESQRVKPIPRVRILNDLVVVSTPGFAEVDQAIFAGLQQSPYQIELYLERPELTLFPDKDLVNWADDARVAAAMAVRILNGERPQAIPVVARNDSYMFDGRALRRWGIRESALPPSSIVLFREPTLWERTKWIWLASLAVILCLVGLAAYLHYSRLQIKIAREAELHLSGMVIHAQEKERSRLAAELHDDFGQRLALLIVGLEDAAESLPPSAVEIKHKLDELIASAGDLGDDLHTLSHRLHSATLDKLGLVTGLRALCEEFTARHGIVVSFSSDGVPRDIQSDVALCLFRIAQEGLQNIKKHSGASRAEVNLRQVQDSLRLRVSDEGKGFDPENMKRQAGLGLRSMEGRAHLLGGRLRILSDQGKGTRIDAIVPLEPQRDRESVEPQ